MYLLKIIGVLLVCGISLSSCARPNQVSLQALTGLRGYRELVMACEDYCETFGSSIMSLRGDICICFPKNGWPLEIPMYRFSKNEG